MKKALLVLGLALGLVASSDAQVLSAQIAKTHIYRQVADGIASPSPFAYVFNAEMTFSSPADATLVTLQWGGNPPWPLTPIEDGFVYTGQVSYDTEAWLQANFPDATSYTFYYSGGFLENGNRTINLGPALYPSHVPVFTGDTYSRARNEYNPGAPFTFTWNQFVADHRAAYSSLRINIKASNGDTVFTRTLPIGTSSVTVAAGTLQRSREYTAELIFRNSLEHRAFPFMIGAHAYMTRFTFVPGFPRFDGTQAIEGQTSGRWSFMTAWNLGTGEFHMSPNWRNGILTWEHPALGHKEWIARFVYDQASMKTRALAWYYRQVHVQ